MKALNIYTYKQKNFYLLDELREYDFKFFSGYAQLGPEKIVNEKNIADYEVVKYGESEWLPSTFAYKKSKLLVSVEWASTNIPKLCSQMKGLDTPSKRRYAIRRRKDKVYFKAKDMVTFKLKAM